MTGGGARVDWDDKKGHRSLRLFLTACHPVQAPDGRWGWRAAAKDIVILARDEGTVWVFGARPRSGVAVPPSGAERLESLGTPPQDAGATHAGEIVIGGGAELITEPLGVLTSNGLSPSGDQWRTRAFAEGPGQESVLYTICRPADC